MPLPYKDEANDEDVCHGSHHPVQRPLVHTTLLLMPPACQGRSHPRHTYLVRLHLQLVRLHAPTQLKGEAYNAPVRP